MVDILPSGTRAPRGAGQAEMRGGPAWPTALNFPPPSRPARSGAELARLIEGEIIPRLMLTHAGRAAGVIPGVGVSPEALDMFVSMTLASESPVLAAHVEALVHGGLPLESAYAEILAPTARRLGDAWNDDLISFTDVTIGLARLQQVVRDLAVSFPPAGSDAGARSACFVTAPGEQHAFGLFLLEDQFRRAGWRTWLDTSATREDAAQTVALDWFDVFGLSATADIPVEAVASTVALVRRCSLNPRLFVMVGGRLFVEHPALAEMVGADAATATAADALSVADKAVKAPAIA